MRRVVITGVGAVSALGSGAEALWRGLLEGRSGVRRVPEAEAMGLPVTSGGVVDFTGADRDVVMAQAAMEEARAQAGLAPEGLFWACALDTFQAGPDGLVHRPAGQCFQALATGYPGPHRMFAVACASGTRSVGEAFQAIRAGRVEHAMAGGSAVMLTPFYLIGFAALRAVATDEDAPDPAGACRPFDAERCGFALADGAGALVLESAEHAAARGARPLAEVIGLGTSMDAHDLNRPPKDGAGAHACMLDALADAGLEPDDVHVINTHGTGTWVGDLAEATAIERLFGGAVPVHGVKGAIGHAMAGAGALEAVVGVRCLQTGLVPSTINLHTPFADLDFVRERPREARPRVVLSNSFGMGGQNASLLLQRMEP